MLLFWGFVCLFVVFCSTRFWTQGFMLAMQWVLFFLFCFWGRVLLHNPSWPPTHSVAQDSHELTCYPVLLGVRKSLWNREIRLLAQGDIISEGLGFKVRLNVGPVFLTNWINGNKIASVWRDKHKLCTAAWFVMPKTRCKNNNHLQEMFDKLDCSYCEILCSNEKNILGLGRFPNVNK
jgi:hypothetical protein